MASACLRHLSGAGVRGSSAPKVNCGIFESELDGVMPVSAVLLAAMNRGRGRHVVAVRPLYGGTDHLLASGLLSP